MCPCEDASWTNSVEGTMPARRFTLTLLLGLTLGLAAAAPARADLNDPVHQWLPSETAASWTWRWADSEHVLQPLVETYTVAKSDGAAFQLAWTTADQPGRGTIDYQRT